MQRDVAVGIDLGTTYSVLAYLDAQGRPVTLPNAEGDLLTPSAVFFDGQEVVVGKEAQKALATDPEEVAQFAKREMGSRAFHRALAGSALPPEVIQGYVLRKLVRDAAARLGEIRRAVITVPAYFDEVRRRATRDAGFLAGLEVLDIINEPVAAAISLAAGTGAGPLGAGGAKAEGETPQAGGTGPEALGPAQRVLVYDLGGGTFDVTVMEVQGGQFTTLSTDGDVQLGGYDWDQRLMNHVAEQFMRQFDADPRTDPAARARLWRECEEAKRSLSTRGRIQLAYDWRGHALRYEVTREWLTELTRDLLDRTKFTVRQALSAAGLTWPQIDRVLLVGGSSRMPAVRQMLKRLAGREPDTSLSPDEAVAQGAALHAGALLARAGGQPSPLRIRNVNSHSLGVVATEPATRRKHNAIVIPRNTPLPVTARRWFQTQRRNQRSLLVQILEGEGTQPEACAPIARCVVRNLPPELPAKTSIEVRFSYQSDGLLQVAVLLAGQDQLLEAEISHANTLGRGELIRWREKICRFATQSEPGHEDDEAAGQAMADTQE